MSNPLRDDTQREFAHRVSGGLEVTLYSNADDKSTSIEVFDAATEVTHHFTVARERALDAFYHPFAHLQTMTDDAAVVRQLRT
jgi:hypothetical protein